MRFALWPKLPPGRSAIRGHYRAIKHKYAAAFLVPWYACTIEFSYFLMHTITAKDQQCVDDDRSTASLDHAWRVCPLSPVRCVLFLRFLRRYAESESGWWLVIGCC